MATQRTNVLISYNDSNQISQNRDYVLANRLADYLRQNGIDAETRGYSTSMLNNTHQWLILIPSPEIVKSASMNKMIGIALDQVVKRRMKGVLAVTTGTSDLPSEWATIRKFDASDPKEENLALQGVWRAMHYAKVPYTEAYVLAQAQQAVVAHQQRTAQKRRILVPLATAIGILVVFALLFSAYQIYIRPTTSVIILTPTVPPTQQEYSNITSRKPTMADFQSKQWSITSKDTASCKIDQSHSSSYHAAIQTFGEYTRCMTTKKFKNFALQVTMNISGDAGGVIFGDDGHGTYYRLAFNQSADTYSVFLCKQGECDTSTQDVGIVGTGSPLALGPVTVDQNKPITFTVIVQGRNIDLYNGNIFLARIPANTTSSTPTSKTTPTPTSSSTPTPTSRPTSALTTTPTSTSASTVNSVSSPTPIAGQIGVFAASLSNPTDVTFSNLKVWSLA